MADSIDKKELVKRVTKRTGKDAAEVEVVVDASLEEIYAALKRGKSVSQRNFGTFYIDLRRTGTVFKFNPSQRLKALFGRSSKL
ncbi:MAG: HU family DNA-binding protein [Anaerolineae bacterium]|jgi:DNA-binding protein HU-beta|nr:HU family DNA-binding protein [Anaerolineae bacterium]